MVFFAKPYQLAYSAAVAASCCIEAIYAHCNNKACADAVVVIIVLLLYFLILYVKYRRVETEY